MICISCGKPQGSNQKDCIECKAFADEQSINYNRHVRDFNKEPLTAEEIGFK